MTDQWTAIDADEAEVHLEGGLIEEATANDGEVMIALSTGERIRIVASDAGTLGGPSVPALTYEFRRGD